jgi:copper chaperone
MCRIIEYPWGVFASNLVEEKIVRGTLRLWIEGMHCDGCVRRVTAALQGVDGVNVDSVQIGSAQMTFSPKHASIDEIVAAVNRIGFSAHAEK